MSTAIVSMVANGRGTNTTDAAVDEFLRDIKSDKWKVAIDHIRKRYREAVLAYSSSPLPENERIKPKDAVATAKRALPGALFSGRFSSRERPVAEKLIEHSGLICADLDHIDDIAGTRAKLSESPYVRAVFLSPTGTGLKVLVRVEPNVERHSASWKAVKAHIMELTELEIDEACKDVSRLCFASWDPDMSNNPNAVELLVPESTSASASAPTPTSTTTSATTPTPTTTTTTTTTSATTSTSASCITTHDSLKVIEIMAEQPKELRKLYEKFWIPQWEAKKGERNHVIVQSVPVLFTRIGKDQIMALHGIFYDCHKSMFNDPKEEHMRETKAMIEGVEASYRAKLSNTEREVYDALNENERAAFRICRDLSLLVEPKREPSTFFLSCGHLGDRLGMYSTEAQRLLRTLETYRLIETIKKGTRRAPGVRGEAGTYRWLLGAPAQAGEPTSPDKSS